MVAAAAYISGDQNWMTILANNETSEAVSNGMWYEVLRRHFPFPRFIIAPEQNNLAGDRPDLTVFAIDATGQRKSVFTFEGKAPKTTTTQMLPAFGQASRYLTRLSAVNGAGGRTFGMFAAGKSVVLMVYNGGGAGQVKQWIRGDVNTAYYNWQDGWIVWNIEVHAQIIDNFLTAFSQLC